MKWLIKFIKFIMTTLNPNKASIAWPAFVQDTIIYDDTWTFSFPNTIGAYQFNIDTAYAGTTGSGLPFGIYSLDNVNWYEINGSDGPVRLVFKTADNSTSAQVIATVNPLVSGYASGATITLTAKLGLFALPASTVLNSPIGGQFAAYKSGVNYNKLYQSGEVNKVASGTVTVPHNLSYATTVKIWDHSAGFYSLNLAAASDGLLGIGILWDETNLYLSAGSGATGSWVYRIYYES